MAAVVLVQNLDVLIAIVFLERLEMLADDFLTGGVRGFCINQAVHRSNQLRVIGEYPAIYQFVLSPVTDLVGLQFTYGSQLFADFAELLF